jgi:hypothetical protein
LFFAIQNISHYLCPILFPAIWKKLDSKKKQDHDARVCSFIHALALLLCSARVMVLLHCHYGLDLAAYIFDGPSRLPAPNPAATELATLYYAFTVGYFIWDLTQCLLDFDHWGASFTIHAFFGVLSLAPPIVYAAPAQMVYFGTAIWLFEASTPFLNMRGFLYTFELAQTQVYKINNILFLLTFTVVRIVFGVPLCLSFIHFTYHTDCHAALKLLWITAGTASCLLNIVWFYQVVLAVFRGSGNKAKKPRDDEDSGKKKD